MNLNCLNTGTGRILNYILVILTFLFGKPGHAQEYTTKELKVGDFIPNLIIDSIVNYDRPSLNLGDLKGKGVILDFWDTWCGSCINQFPKLTQLETKFDGKLRVIGVTKNQSTPINDFLNKFQQKKGIKITSIVSDTLLSKLFKHRFIPHYVWIDKQGRVRAITGSESINEDNIRALLEEQKITAPIKVDSKFKFDRSKPLFGANQALYDDGLSYHSVITRYIQQIQFGESTYNSSGILCTNHPILLLYKIAFGEFDLSYLGNDRIVLSGFNTKEDSLNIGYFDDSTVKLYEQRLKRISYNYELFVKDSSFSKKEMFEIMRTDLNRYFKATQGISAKLDRKKIKVLELVRSTKNDLIKTAGDSTKVVVDPFSITIKNKGIWKLIQLLYVSNPNFKLAPIVDKTGYKNNIDIEISNYSEDLDTVNKSLKKYGLKLKYSTNYTTILSITKTIPD